MSGKRWSDHDDRFLVFYGAAVGYDFVASHDLGRPKGAGTRRMRWLRKHMPELVAHEEAEAGKMRDDWKNPA